MQDFSSSNRVCVANMSGVVVPEWEYWCLLCWFLGGVSFCLGYLLTCLVDWCCHDCLGRLFGPEEGDEMPARDVPLVDFHAAN